MCSNACWALRLLGYAQSFSLDHDASGTASRQTSAIAKLSRAGPITPGPPGPQLGTTAGTIGARAGAGGAAQPHRIPVEQVLADHPAGSPLGGVPPLGINIQQYHLGITV
jgi:hypothetical protein